jgi:hypothetical protein
MVRIKEHGDGLTVGSVAPTLVVQNPTSRMASPPIQGDRFARNGLLPDVALISNMNDQTNQCALYRTKAVHFLGAHAGFMPPSSASATRARWRFPLHTGPYTHAIRVSVTMIPQDSNPGNNTYARLDIANSAGAVVRSLKFFHGANPGGTATVPAGWNALKTVTLAGLLSPDTDYYGTFYDIDSCRLTSGTVAEMVSMTQHFSGYLPKNLTTQSDILDCHRQNLVQIQRALWRRGAANVFNWTADGDDITAPYGTGPIAITTNTPTNIIDTTSTVVSASTPGPTWDMRYKNRVSQTTGVPVRMECYGKMGVGATTGGRVYVKDSTGAVIGSIVDQWTSTTPAWKSTTFNLPANVSKYDLQFARAGASDAGNPFTLYALGIYEYEA